MSLHNGIDTVAWVSIGLFTKTYGVADQENINSLFVSLGMLESAPEPSAIVLWLTNILGKLFKTRLMEF